MLFMLQKSYSCYIKKATSLLYIKKNTQLSYSFLLLKTKLNLLTTRGWNLLKKENYQGISELSLQLTKHFK